MTGRETLGSVDSALEVRYFWEADLVFGDSPQSGVAATFGQQNSLIKCSSLYLFYLLQI